MNFTLPSDPNEIKAWAEYFKKTKHLKRMPKDQEIFLVFMENLESRDKN